MTDDSGTAAMSVSAKLLALRQDCDRMDIKWHWRHKESTLEELIKEKKPSLEIKATSDNFVLHTTVTPEAPESEREKRHVPQDVLDALAYCDGYHRGNTKCIRAYIEEIR